MGPKREWIGKMLGISRWLGFIIAICTASLSRAEDLSPLAQKPRWQTLERYQETMSRSQFTNLLDSIYATRGYGDLIEIGDDAARIVEDRAARKFFVLRFSAWRTSSGLIRNCESA